MKKFLRLPTAPNVPVQVRWQRVSRNDVQLDYLAYTVSLQGVHL